MTDASTGRPGSLFSVPGYPAWFGADTFLLCSSAVHWIVVSLMAYRLSGSVTLAGWFATARGIVSVVTQVLGGTFIDRHDHRTLILVQSGSCGILWFVMGLLFVTGRLTFFLFAGLCLASSAIFGFLDGTSNAALIRVVGPSRYAQAESINQGRDAAVRTAGSPIGAALFGIAESLPFFASAICDAAAFVSALFLRFPEEQGQRRTTPNAASFFGDLIEGWQWVFASRLIMSSVLIIGLSEFGAFAMHQAINLQLVSSDTDALLISLVNVVSGMATLIGSLISARVCDRIPVGKGIVVILALIGLGYLPLVFSGSYAAIIASSIMASLPMPLFAALVNGFVFSKTPVDRQGRTRAAVMTTIMLFGSMSGAVAGELLPRLGFHGVVLLMMGLIAVSVVLAAANPLIRAIPASPHWDEVSL
ncbi:MAG: MFS transporter [Atopobiaceae bacterium]|nr:MFS transporter [Atopobiaceae bacterium]